MRFGMPFLLETPTVENAASLCRELGLSFVELNMNFPACQLDKLDPAELRALKDRYDIFFTLHLEEDCDPFSFNRGVKNAWLDSMKRSFDVAKAIDAPVVNMHLPKGIYITLPGERVYLHERYAEEYFQSAIELRDLCLRELQGCGTRLCVENTDGFATHERKTLSMLLEAPVFGLTLDMGHSHAVGDADIPFFMEHDHKLIHMHGHDAKGKSNHLALGDGEIDLHGRFAWAKRNKANVVLETKTVAALRTSVGRLKEYLK